MPCASCSNDNTVNSVSNSNTTDCSCEPTACDTTCEPTSCGAAAGASNCRCRLAVTVDNDFSPCTFQQDYFDVTVTNRDGELVASGKVAGGSSAVFTLPAEGEYAVTVTGGAFASPRAQTRRVRCCCGQPNGVSFIFMKLEQDCVRKPPHHCCCPPVPRPPMPPCPHEPPKPPCHHHGHPGGGIDPHDVILVAEGSLQDFQ